MGINAKPIVRPVRSTPGLSGTFCLSSLSWFACCLIAFILFRPVPSSGSLFNFSVKDEVELGQEFKVLISSQFPVIHDPEITGYFDQLLQRIRSAMPAQPFPLSITVIRDKSLNAFAAPAGYVYIHSGLILAMQDESELAGVVAHELAHASERHLARHIEQSKLISIGTAAGILAGALLSGSGDLGRAVAVGSMAGGKAAALKYTRDDEREADQIGLQYLRQSGFDPYGLLRAFQRIQQSKILGGTSSPPTYMLTHPGIPERIGYLQDMLDREAADQGGATKEITRFAKIRMLIRAKYTEPELAVNHYRRMQGGLSCLDSLGLGIALERMNKVLEAEKYFEQSANCREISSLANRESGRFFFLTGKYRRALSYLEQAIASRPNDYLSLYYKARILKEEGKLDEAVEVLQRILRFLPEVAEVHSLLGQVCGRNGDAFKGYLHLAYGALYKNDEEKTEAYLRKMQPLAQNHQQQLELDDFRTVYNKRKKFW